MRKFVWVLCTLTIITIIIVFIAIGIKYKTKNKPNLSNQNDLLEENADNSESSFAFDVDNRAGDVGVENQSYNNLIEDSPENIQENMESSEDGEPFTFENAQEDMEGSEDGEPFTFVDVFGEEYQTEIIPGVPQKVYINEGFVRDEDKLLYEDEKFSSRLGIDVSRHQGHIDWEKVKNAGYDFAFIRIGYRGYGKSGSINLDKTFKQNIENAHNAGIDVGVYFFAQAINEEEALEEAEFVLENLAGYDLELPVVYDPESILNDTARTDNVTGEQFTRNTIEFCSRVKEAGYEVAIYSNMLWEAFQFDMNQLCGYTIWYADYELYPQTPYDFTYWQYSESGHVDGIDGVVNLDIEFLSK